MKKQNYYERVIKKRQAIMHDPFFIKFAQEKKLTKPAFKRAAVSIMNGSFSFQA